MVTDLVAHMAMHMGIFVPLAWQASLSSAQLVGLSKSERNELLGQRLLGLVAIVDPKGADEITGVLLEMQVQPVDTHADVHHYWQRHCAAPLRSAVS